jgi:hypothetical protein
MPVRVFKTGWFARYTRKERISDQTLWSTIVRAEDGLIDADLGCGVIKQRLARPGQGKSAGYRAIIVFRTKTRAIFVYGFAKNVRANIDADELDAYRDLAQLYLAKSEKEIDAYVADGTLVEVIGDDEAD